MQLCSMTSKLYEKCVPQDPSEMPPYGKQKPVTGLCGCSECITKHGYIASQFDINAKTARHFQVVADAVMASAMDNSSDESHEFEPFTKLAAIPTADPASLQRMSNMATYIGAKFKSAAARKAELPAFGVNLQLPPKMKRSSATDKAVPTSGANSQPPAKRAKATANDKAEPTSGANPKTPAKRARTTATDKTLPNVGANPKNASEIAITSNYKAVTTAITVATGMLATTSDSSAKNATVTTNAAAGPKAKVAPAVMPQQPPVPWNWKAQQ